MKNKKEKGKETEIICVENIGLDISADLLGDIAKIVDIYPPLKIAITEGSFEITFIENDKLNLLANCCPQNKIWNWRISNNRISHKVARLILAAYHNVLI